MKLDKYTSLGLHWALSFPLFGLAMLWMWRLGAPARFFWYGLAFMLVCSSVLCATSYLTMRRSDCRRIAPHCYWSYGYDLTGNTSGRYPECGTRMGRQPPEASAGDR